MQRPGQPTTQLVGQCGRRQVTHLWARDGFEPLRSNMLHGQFSRRAMLAGDTSVVDALIGIESVLNSFRADEVIHRLRNFMRQGEARLLPQPQPGHLDPRGTWRSFMGGK